MFRDGDDITGTDYNESIERSLRASSKLLLICSPAARESRFVDDEVRRFAMHRGPEAIIPVLVDGIPNNEADAANDSNQAFPQALCEHVEFPLAVEYRGFSTERQRVDKKEWENSWYTLLSNIYEIGRAEIEQRERRRRIAKSSRTWAQVTTVLAALGLLGWVAISQARLRIGEAAVAASQVRSTSLAGAAMARLDARPDEALFLAIEALREAETFEAWEAVQSSAGVRTCARFFERMRTMSSAWPSARRATAS